MLGQEDTELHRPDMMHPQPVTVRILATVLLRQATHKHSSITRMSRARRESLWKRQEKTTRKHRKKLPIQMRRVAIERKRKRLGKNTKRKSRRLKRKLRTDVSSYSMHRPYLTH